MNSPSRIAIFAKLAVAARKELGADDPLVEAVEAFVDGGCRGTLDDALGVGEPSLSRREQTATRNALMRQLYRRFNHLSERDQVAAAYERLSSYLTKWPRRRFIVDGGHGTDEGNHLCWRIFGADPDLYMNFISLRRFRQIVTGK